MINQLNWLKQRQHGIGGSDVAAIFGKSSYKDPYDIYLSKVNPITEASQETGLTKLGKALEPTILKEYESFKGVTLATDNPDIFKHQENQFMLASLDGLDKVNNVIVEAKMCFYNKDQWINAGQYSIPVQYLLQVAHYCYVLNAEYADVIVYFVNEQKYQVITYVRDPNLEKAIIEGCYAFWNNHVLKKIPPKATDLSFQSVLKDFNLDKMQESHTASTQILEIIENCNSLQSQMSELEKKVKSYKADIINYCQENNAKKLISPETNKPLVNLISYKGRTTLDSALLKQENPEIYTRYLKESSGYNVLKINKIGG
jgi:putative phage-type endonuclease